MDNMYKVLFREYILLIFI